MKIYYDFEFIDDGIEIQPISVGMLSESGAEYYAVFADVFWPHVMRHDWLRENVVPHLPTKLDPKHNNELWMDYEHPDVKSTRVIRGEIEQFLLNAFNESQAVTDELELWGWYSAYDHVALAQLWGPMAKLPKFVPMWTNDIRQEFQRFDNPKFYPSQPITHNALDDAKYHKELHDFIIKYAEKNWKKNLRFA